MRNRARIIAGAALVAAVLGGLWAFNARHEDLTDRRVKAILALKGASGASPRLEALRGHPVLVHFWATWCPPCLEELPEWLGLVQKLEPRGVKAVAVSLDKSWADASRLLPESKLPPNLVSLLDPEMRSAEEFGSYQYPETYLLGPDLRLVQKFVGPQNWSDPRILELIEKAAAPGPAGP